ncbi:MAG: LamG-like jellyroll fold domain-containing protein [Bacteroidota bacterium]
MKKIVLICLLGICMTRLSAQPCSSNPWSMNFNGISTNIAIYNTTSLDITDHLTVEAWINAAQWATSSWSGSIVSKDGWSAGEFGFALRAGGTGELSFIIGGWNPNNTAASWQEVISPLGSMTLNTWYHVAGTFDGEKVKSYINGILVDSLSFTGTILTSAGFPMRIGEFCDTAHGTRYWNGLIDEVRVWHRVLGAAELQAHMHMHIDTSVVQTNLVGYWRFNEGPGNVMHDLSGLGNDGILFNGFPSGNVPFTNTPPLTPTINYSSGHLNCNATGTFTYQWYFNGNILSGATNQTLVPAQYGNYTVQITTLAGCSSTSASFNYNNTGTSSIVISREISLSPNPASDYIDIKTAATMSQINVLDLAGRIIISIKVNSLDYNRLDVSTLKPGIYLLKCQTTNAGIVRRIVIR